MTLLSFTLGVFIGFLMRGGNGGYEKGFRIGWKTGCIDTCRYIQVCMGKNFKGDIINTVARWSHKCFFSDEQIDPLKLYEEEFKLGDKK